MLKLINILFLLCCVSTVHAQPGSTMKLWYRQPAREWMESTPAGNGRLGVNVFGGINNETIALNEVTMWAGQPDADQEKPCGKEKLAEIRRVFFSGDLIKGNGMATEYLSGTPHSFGTHVPVGDLRFTFGYDTTDITGYNRQLDLHTGMTTVEFGSGGVGYKREYFCSNPDGVLVVRFTADRAKALTFETALNLVREAEFRGTGNELEFNGKVSFPNYGPGGVNFTGKVNVRQKGGKISNKDQKIRVEGADEVVIVLDIRTDYKNPEYREICKRTVEKAAAQKYSKLQQRHIQDHSALFGRVELNLGSSKADVLPTDERWARVRNGSTDPGLDALFFQYGRYLLIASSREDSPLPANLQGIWNDNLACNMCWSCDYHLDINTQQNYWAANVTNLHECNAPLFTYIESLAEDGEKTAAKVYGSPGWVAHTVANVWGYTAPGGGVNWGLFPTASSWMASHLWSHYCYTQDQEFLRNQGYPLLKKNAVFFLDYMTEDPNTGYLVTGPSTSAENSFMHDGWELSLSMMPTCDRVLVYELYRSCIQASEILGIDAGFRDSLQQALKKFPPLLIGKNGEIKEWLADVEAAHVSHRHTSHLLALYPFSQISMAHTPELAVAARKVIDNKLSDPGWEDVEWSRANMINFYARLKAPQEAYQSIVFLMRKLTRENLLTVSPKGIAGAPYDLFILDGNEAATSGIAEMLVQGHEGYIEFLPALPQEWNTGHVKGLCVQGGAETEVSWEKGEVKKAAVKARVANTFTVKLPQLKNYAVTLNGRKALGTPDEKGLMTFQMKANDLLEIQCF